MNNPITVDRRDVAHPTNPIGSNKQIEQEDLGLPFDDAADKPPVGGRAYTGAQKPNLPDGPDAEIHTSFEQPVEGAENKLRINRQTHLPEVVTPESS